MNKVQIVQLDNDKYAVRKKQVLGPYKYLSFNNTGNWYVEPSHVHKYCTGTKETAVAMLKTLSINIKSVIKEYEG